MAEFGARMLATDGRLKGISERISGKGGNGGLTPAIEDNIKALKKWKDFISLTSAEARKLAESMGRVESSAGAIANGKLLDGATNPAGMFDLTPIFGAEGSIVDPLRAQLDPLLEYLTQWGSQWLAQWAAITTGSTNFAVGLVATYEALGAVAGVLDVALGANNKFAQGLRKIQAGILLVSGVVSVFQGAIKIAEGIFPFNPGLILSGSKMVVEGTAAIAQAKQLGASGASPSGRASGGGAGAGAGRGVNQSDVNTPRTQDIRVYVEGLGIVQDQTSFVRELTTQIERQARQAGR
jgi:hypothetical protein